MTIAPRIPTKKYKRAPIFSPTLTINVILPSRLSLSRSLKLFIINKVSITSPHAIEAAKTLIDMPYNIFGTTT